MIWFRFMIYGDLNGRVSLFCHGKRPAVALVFACSNHHAFPFPLRFIDGVPVVEVKIHRCLFLLPGIIPHSFIVGVRGGERPVFHEMDLVGPVVVHIHPGGVGQVFFAEDGAAGEGGKAE